MDRCLLDPSHRPARRLFERGPWTVTRCPTCGLIMTGSPGEESIFDDPDYYTMGANQRDEIYADWAFRWRWILGRLNRFGRPGRLLDVGAGNGLFVKIAQEEFGWQARGIVLSETEVAFAKRALDVSLDRVRLEDVGEVFDLVTTFNVLEHVVDPVAFLQLMSRRLSTNGLVALSTPSSAAIQARLQGLKAWRMIAPPHHVNIFSRRALELTLRKAGFEVLSYDAISTYIRALRRIEPNGTFLKNIVFNGLRRTGLGADHFVVARKIEPIEPAIRS